MSDADQLAAAERIVGLYRDHASEWDAARTGQLERAGFFERGWLERFLALVPPGGEVLDLGCGGGAPIATHLAASGRRLTGVDSAPGLIALCRQRLRGHDWIVADMRGLALGRRFDGILAWDSFFHLTGAAQAAMFAIFAAHARPGAALMFTSGPRDGVAMGEMFGEALFHASLAPGRYRALLAAHGFEVIGQRSEDPDCAGRTVWLARKAQQPESVAGVS